MENIIVPFIPEDFKGNHYLKIDDCPAARAISRSLNKKVSVGASNVSEGFARYRIVGVNLNGESISEEIGFQSHHYRTINKAIHDGSFVSAHLELEKVK